MTAAAAFLTNPSTDSQQRHGDLTEVADYLYLSIYGGTNGFWSAVLSFSSCCVKTIVA
jgi:hypothetical protein